MSDRTLKILLIDRDPIFRTGLRVVIEQFRDLEVAAEAETKATALQILAELSSNAISTSEGAVDLVVLELCLDHSQSQHNQMLGLQFCRQLKTQYPNLPILLLSFVQEPSLLAVAQQAGVDGYCPKGISVSDLVTAVRQVAVGKSYWVTGEKQARSKKISPSYFPIPGIFATLRHRWRLSGLQQIEASLTEVTAQLQIPGLPLLDRAFLAGQQRELLASRWLVNHLLAVPEIRESRAEIPPVERTGVQGLGIRDDAFELQHRLSEALSPEIALGTTEVIRTLQADLFESTLAKLQFSLRNLTGGPLEIDIFREEKKRELLKLILRKLRDVLDELRFSQIQMNQLSELQSVIVRDLWQAATTDFFGKYSMLRVGDASGKGTQRNLEIVNLLLQDAPVVQIAILDEIPLVGELFAYLLFQTPLMIDNVPYAASSLEARKRAELILDNLLVQVANGVVQPLLNQFADVEAIKQSFYDQHLISTREIEQFRNNLSWKYRLNNYIDEPKAIFESRYALFVLVSRGIAKISIYAPRSPELAQLSGIQLAVTLVLEIRDAIAPRLRTAVAFLSSGIVYVLTQVVGRAIGLIGRGILQGISGSLPESKFGRNSERPKMRSRGE